MDRKKLSVKEERREEVRIIPIDLIEPDPEQPRKSFDEEKIRELADSIKYHGLLQPILVRPNDGKYQICLLYTSPSPRDLSTSRMPSSA